MKILWVTNVEVNKIAEYYNRKSYFGGWLNTICYQLADEGHSLIIASKIDKSFNEYNNVTLNGITYFSFYEENISNIIKQIFLTNCFDVIHIWGTEYKHSLEVAMLCNQYGLVNKTIVSIQGLISYYANHYLTGLPINVIKHKTLKEWIGRPNILKCQAEMLRDGKNEVQTLKILRNCIGRTDWDLACVKMINPNIQYYYCGETLRQSFYENRWDINKCKKHSIFFSQAHYPIKGFHNLLNALRILVEQFNDINVHVVGQNPFNIPFYKLSSYQKYIIELIRNNKLEKRIKWLGNLDENMMIQEYCQANVFVSSSNIENSSNSIGEAMLLGMPIVASDVGGIKSLATHKKDILLYQETAPYMLAYYIYKIFKDDLYAIKLGNNAYVHAKVNYDKNKNLQQILEIYGKLCGK